MRLPLIDGQGNFGSVDGDPPAADALHRVPPRPRRRMPLLDDLDKDTVDFTAELRRVAARSRRSCRRSFPNLLVNGAGGIAVGMATNIPPHNLGEVIDACIAYIDNPDDLDRRADRDRPGPGLPDRRHDPRPRRHPRRLPHRPRLDHHARASRTIEEIRKEREAIIVTEIPYQVNKAHADREDRRAGAREEASRASPTSATSPTATACASSSS